jgi:hypothetical protein
MLTFLAKYWCRIRRAHRYGDPIAIWGHDAAPSLGPYRQVRCCPHCGDTYDIYAEFMDEPEREGVKKAA